MTWASPPSASRLPIDRRRLAVVLDGVSASVARGRPRRHPRSERLRQDDAASAARRVAAAFGGRIVARRRRSPHGAPRDRRAADGDGAAGNAARLRVHGARDGDDGALSAPRARSRSKGRRISRLRARRLRATGTDHLAVAAVQHAVRRRKTARRHCRRAWRRIPTFSCSTSRRHRSILPISSRFARFSTS